jgi:hypothetical protein
MMPVETLPTAWAEYRARLIPETSKSDIERVVGQRVDLVAIRHRLEQLQVGLFHHDDEAFPSYHLVQLGEDVPDCERLVGYRYTREGTWYGPQEYGASYFAPDSIIEHLTLELQLRQEVQQFFKAPREGGRTWPIPSHQAYWQVHKLTSLREGRWVKLAVRLQALHEAGRSWQELHNLLYHYNAWLAVNPEFEGMPRELVLRTHGLADLTRTEYWLKLQAFGEDRSTKALRAHQAAANLNS